MYKLPSINTHECLDEKMTFDDKGESDWSPLALTNARAKDKRESFFNYFWVAFVKDEFDVGSLIHTEAEFSYAVAVMDKIGGWEERNEQEDQNGARFGASMWINIITVVCNGQRRMEPS